MRTPSFSLLSSALLLVGGAVAGCNGKQAASCVDASIVALSGTPVGTEVKHGNGEFVRNETASPFLLLTLTVLPVTLYITKPDKNNARAKAREGIAVLYLTDVFGIALAENKLSVPPFLLSPPHN